MLSISNDKVYKVDMNNLFKSRQLKVDVIIPKFKIEMELDLKEPLKQMGVKRIFSQGKAELSGMTKGSSLTVTKVVQKCVIKVDEEGSEAAAATAIITTDRSGFPPPTPPKFHANKPFLYFIVERSSGAILYSGRLVDPSQTRL